MEAVHAALRQAFKILPGDRNVRLTAHEPHRFACPPARGKPGLYTHVSIDALRGAQCRQSARSTVRSSRTSSV